MSIPMREPYAPRPIRPLGLWTIGPWRLKSYGIRYGAETPRPDLIAAARRAVEHHLSTLQERHTIYGLGFVGIHDGRGESQVFLSRWANENELLHTTWISPTDRPEALRPAPADQNIACVWDLAVMCFERQAWLEEVLIKSDERSTHQYLERTFSGIV